jgi:hypothetical protein
MRSGIKVAATCGKTGYCFIIQTCLYPLCINAQTNNGEHCDKEYFFHVYSLMFVGQM